MRAAGWLEEIEGHAAAALDAASRGEWFEAGLQAGCAGAKLNMLSRLAPDVYEKVSVRIDDELAELKERAR